MITEIILGLLFLYCVFLHAQIKKLKHSEKYGSPKSEKNIETLWQINEELKEKISEYSSRLWEVEHKVGMHPPHVNI